MKIAVCSDLHLEFGDINLQNTDNADVLILGGDICVAADIGRPDKDNLFEGARSHRVTDFFKRCSFQFPHVIYIMGNHEHYNGDFATSGNKIKSMLESNMLSNVYLLDKEIKTIDDVTFVGGTLWTDMNKHDEMTMQHVTHRMNDFRCVENSLRMISRKVPIYELNPDYTEDGKNGGKYATKEGGGYIEIGHKRKEGASTFSPLDAFEDHKKMLGYIQSVIEGKFDQKFVVVGHHAPSKLSTHPRYVHDTLMNGAYSSSLDEYIMDHPQIKLWTHGHTHEDFDYMIKSTRIVCNPRGYINYEGRADNFQLKYVEI
jgi:Icc-related predicted phosphoesterase